MKIAFGSLAMILLCSVAAQGQMGQVVVSRGGGGGGAGGAISGAVGFSILPWAAPARLEAINVSGSDATFLPSTFVTFESAVAQGKIEITEQRRTVVQAAAASRKALQTRSRVQYLQDDRGNVILAAK